MNSVNPTAVTARAPGKLMIAGEYAVLTPGRPAIVAAVDRYVSVTATPCTTGGDVELVTDLLSHPVPLRRTATGLRTLLDRDREHLTGALERLVAVVHLIDGLRAELGMEPVRVRLAVRSALHEAGTKIGLGSSGAVTAAAVHALTRFTGMPLAAEVRFRLALLASITVDAAPSGADVAASVWHGWICYSPPDRTALLHSLRRQGVVRTLCAPWSGWAVQALPPPADLTLMAGWTGSPASTSGKVSELRTLGWWKSRAHHDFLARSGGVVSAMGSALEQREPQLLLNALDRAGALLADLDGETGLNIYTDRLTALCRTARQCGAVAKPSGAGGGDCGIALLSSRVCPDALRHRWSSEGITPLVLSTAPPPTAEAGPPQRVGPQAPDYLRGALTPLIERAPR
ncbi:phosphomevalonate kinase [Streptomyces sp. NBC_00237]|uniref:phosphomevalonate kinase n=1 Tax=Streptomyces sp. NBC_00237 TaxID=2975687 RepID=UPI00225BE5B2|nr:phosphomevalonate kinase [Streptomyces sp. NBC_00237]MCX5205737.1 phosphomevalonate kinase [Streptomyces sp. NBC_00237]